MSVQLIPLPKLKTMTSDQKQSTSKTLAFLARRVGALERQNAALEANQSHFKPIIEQMASLMEHVEELQIENQRLALQAFELLDAVKAHLTRNEADHGAILAHLGIK